MAKSRQPANHRGRSNQRSGESRRGTRNRGNGERAVALEGERFSAPDGRGGGGPRRRRGSRGRHDGNFEDDRSGPSQEAEKRNLLRGNNRRGSDRYDSPDQSGRSGLHHHRRQSQHRDQHQDQQYQHRGPSRRVAMTDRAEQGNGHRHSEDGAIASFNSNNCCSSSGSSSSLQWSPRDNDGSFEDEEEGRSLAHTPSESSPPPPRQANGRQRIVSDDQSNSHGSSLSMTRRRGGSHRGGQGGSTSGKDRSLRYGSGRGYSSGVEDMQRAERLAHVSVRDSRHVTAPCLVSDDSGHAGLSSGDSLPVQNDRGGREERSGKNVGRRPVPIQVEGEERRRASHRHRDQGNMRSRGGGNQHDCREETTVTGRSDMVSNPSYQQPVYRQLPHGDGLIEEGRSPSQQGAVRFSGHEDSRRCNGRIRSDRSASPARGNERCSRDFPQLSPGSNASGRRSQSFESGSASGCSQSFGSGSASGCCLIDEGSSSDRSSYDGYGSEESFSSELTFTPDRTRPPALHRSTTAPTHEDNEDAINDADDQVAHPRASAPLERNGDQRLRRPDVREACAGLLRTLKGSEDERKAMSTLATYFADRQQSADPRQESDDTFKKRVLKRLVGHVKMLETGENQEPMPDVEVAVIRNLSWRNLERTLKKRNLDRNIFEICFKFHKQNKRAIGIPEGIDGEERKKYELAIKVSEKLLKDGGREKIKIIGEAGFDLIVDISKTNIYKKDVEQYLDEMEKGKRECVAPASNGTNSDPTNGHPDKYNLLRHICGTWARHFEPIMHELLESETLDRAKLRNCADGIFERLRSAETSDFIGEKLKARVTRS